MTPKNDSHFEENWLFVWKMTWGIWWNVMQVAKSLIICTLMGLLLSNVCNVWAKKYRVLCCEKWYILADTDAFKTSSGRLKRSLRLKTKQDVVMTSGKVCRIYDVLKISDLRCLQDVWFTTSWRHLIYVILKTSNLGRLENVWLTTSSRRLI